jgi:hypothetical protein
MLVVEGVNQNCSTWSNVVDSAWVRSVKMGKMAEEEVSEPANAEKILWGIW